MENHDHDQTFELDNEGGSDNIPPDQITQGERTGFIRGETKVPDETIGTNADFLDGDSANFSIKFDVDGDSVTGTFDTLASESSGELTEGGQGDLTNPNSVGSRTGVTSNSQITDQQDDASSTKLPEEIASYQIVRELGRGGMGVVYHAHDPTLRRDVAMKMILSSELVGRSLLMRFKTEAEAVARLQHPNIVQIFEVGSDNDRPYIALEFVDGPDMAAWIKEKPISPELAAQSILTLAQAMQYAHDKNVLHRDLKPANVLVGPAGQLKISDFGLAKHLDDNESGKTTTGDILGTPSYMAPEQAAGHSELIGPATDQYALGSMLYALITGRPPFLSAKAMDTVSKVINDEPLPPGKMVSELPRDLETICLKTLQKNPSERYSNCKELAADLQRFLNNEPIAARPISTAERTWRWCKRNPKIAIPTGLAAGLLASLIALGSVSYAMIAQQKDRAESNLILAKENEATAIENQQLAEKNAAIAQEREAEARAQAMALMKNVQYVLTDIDPALAKQPGSTDLRTKIALHQVEVWNKIDKAVRNDEQGEAVPTLLGVRFRLAQLFGQLGKIEESNEQLDQAIEIARQRIVVKKNSDASRLNLVKVLLTAAMLRDRFGRDVAVSTELKSEARDLTRSILDTPKPEPGSPSLYEIHEVLAECTQRLGAARMSEGRIEESKKLILEARDIRVKNLDRLEKTEKFRNADAAGQIEMKAENALVLDKSTMGVAYTKVKQGQAEDGLRLFKSVLESRKSAYVDAPQLPKLRTEYAGFAGLLADCLMWNDRLADALENVNQSFRITKSFYDDNPKNLDHIRRFGLAAYRRGCIHFLRGDKEAAAADMQQSIAARQKLVDLGDGEKDKMDLCLSLAWAGDAEKAKPILKTFAELESDDAEIQLKASRAWSSLARGADGDLQDEYRDMTFKTLERAIEEGYSDPFKVRVEPEFHWIRESAEFRDLVGSIK
jgi:serine/threonine-protein kinase